MTVLEQVLHLPLLPGAHWLVVLCLLGSQCASATLSSWHQGYVAVDPNHCDPVHAAVHLVYTHAACRPSAAHVRAFDQQAVNVVVWCSSMLPQHDLESLYPAFIMLGDLLFQRQCQCSLCSAHNACVYPLMTSRTMCMMIAPKHNSFLLSAAGILNVG